MGYTDVVDAAAADTELSHALVDQAFPRGLQQHVFNLHKVTPLNNKS
jgi:hypothetical protein